ncbi:MAG: polysaccharide deacetylase family protein [Bacteroidota bacterium]
MISISSSDHNRKEKEYVFDYIFKDRLGVDYIADFTGNQDGDYLITSEGKQVVRFVDVFFRKYHKNLQYLDIKNIPGDVSFYNDHTYTESDIPVIFGEGALNIAENEISIGFDIIAGIFFCLTRWEEYVSEERDVHGRFPGSSSWIVRNGIELRPVVDEYIDFLRKVLEKSGYPVPENAEKYKAVISHDVDFMWKYPGSMKTLKSLGGDILKRGDPGKFARNLKNRIKNEPDPYDTFDFLMKLSEQKNIRSQFNFIPVNTGSFPAKYDIREKSIIELIQHIKGRGHQIGIHPSYDSFMNPDKLAKELEIIRKIDPMTDSGRQHFLRFSAPETWNHWYLCGLVEDSSLGYEDNIGFRCGTAQRYRVFDFLNRKSLELFESPLLAMDVALIRQFGDSDDILPVIEKMAQKVKSVKGRFVILWHNNTFDEYGYKEYMNLYRSIVEMIA